MKVRISVFAILALGLFAAPAAQAQTIVTIGSGLAHDCYLHAKDAWVEQARIYRFSMSTRSAHALESPESLLGMLDFLPKPKGFRKMLPSQKDLRKMYEGKL